MSVRNKPKTNEDINPVDKVTMDIPLLIRILELARETLQNDIVIHTLTTYLVDKSKTGQILTMNCYHEIEQIVKQHNDPEPEEHMETAESCLEDIRRLAGLIRAK